ncbi:MAG: RHS repeat-associated core domain-containing protein [Candidatus Woesearchaeota archaeon]
MRLKEGIWLVLVIAVSVALFYAVRPHITGMAALEPSKVTTYASGSGGTAWFSSNEGVSFQHSDYMGSTRLLTRESGVKSASFFSAPFGEALEQEKSNDVSSRFMFTGKEQDNSGLQYFGARYLITETGRFASVDPKPSANPYPYVHNNPLAYFDPDGREDLKAVYFDNVVSMLKHPGDVLRGLPTIVTAAANIPRYLALPIVGTSLEQLPEQTQNSFSELWKASSDYAVSVGRSDVAETVRIENAKFVTDGHLPLDTPATTFPLMKNSVFFDARIATVYDQAKASGDAKALQKVVHYFFGVMAHETIHVETNRKDPFGQFITGTSETENTCRTAECNTIVTIASDQGVLYPEVVNDMNEVDQARKDIKVDDPSSNVWMTLPTGP